MSWRKKTWQIALAGAIAVAFLCLPQSAEAQRHHTVRSGQSLALIARRNHTSVWNIAAANRISPNASIRPGQTLIVPPRGVVFVRPGQTLSHIARENRCSVEALARANHMRPSSPLRVRQRLMLPGFSSTVANDADRDWGEPDDPGVVRIRTRTEEATVRLVDEEGRVLESGLEALAELMHRGDAAARVEEQNADEDDEDAVAAEEEELDEDEYVAEDGEGLSAPLGEGPDTAVELPHPRLAALLASISDHFGGREIRLVSGFREVGGFTRETSRHVRGHATDIKVSGVSKRALWDYCRSLRNTGCGLYPRSIFVHVDVRDRASQWVDWSGPGRRPRYGNLRGPWRRRSRQRRREGRHITRPDEVPLEVQVIRRDPRTAEGNGEGEVARSAGRPTS